MTIYFKNKDTLILKEILSHYGRLKSWIPFYLETQHEKTGENLKKFYIKVSHQLS